MKWKNEHFRIEFAIQTFKELSIAIIVRYFKIGTFLGTLMGE